MKKLFSKPGKSVRLADKERMIFDFGNGNYYDIKGNPVPAEDTFIYEYNDDTLCNPWEQDWIEDEGIEEKLISASTIEPEYEIDDIFGNFGFKNKEGEFVIEPQYAFAHEFTCGLAAVNLNRTWYKTEEGHRHYENHFGYIDKYGKTIIPFVYDEAWPFNRYGVAVVETLDDVFLIDLTGKVIPGTENFVFEHYYDYDNRFLEFTDKKANFNYKYGDDLPVGLYDTKERKVILEPSMVSVVQYSEDEILVNKRGKEYGEGDSKEYYINSKGEKLYPWLDNKNFEIVERPNKSRVTVVAVSKYIELTGNPLSYFSINGKKYDRVFMYGLYSPKEFFILPMEYEEITEIIDNVFACQKDGICTLIVLDESDYYPAD